MKQTPPTSRAGFTLVELIATMAISLILMATLSHTIGSVAQSSYQHTSLNQPPIHHTDYAIKQLTQLIRQDLTHAQSFKMTPNRLQLTTRHTIDPTQSTPRHQTSTITYHIEHIGDTTWLTRHQHPIDSPTPRPAHQRLLPDVQALGLTLLPESNNTPSNPNARPTQSVYQRTLQLRLTAVQTDATFFSHTFLLPVGR